MAKTPVQYDFLPEYDFVIVGGGTAGCVLSSRLSEESDKTVLLLEAGGDDLEVPDIALPEKAPFLPMTKLDWGCKTLPQQNAFKGMENNLQNLPKGKVLGGSGSINYMMYMRGTPHDYDLWENMGCTGWSYMDVLPYFIKSERCLIPKLANADHRGRKGRMLVSESGVTPLTNSILEAGRAMGYGEVDLNGENPLGFMVNQSNIGDGIRQGPAECFLRHASSRVNLHIATHCHATKVLFDKKIAYAVEYVRDSIQQSQIVRARQEIILCGGAISSPQILMLSGIGPAEHLESLRIDVVSELPVGDNLQNHTGTFGLDFELQPPNSVCSSSVHTKDMVNSTGWIRTKQQDPLDPNPDIHLVIQNAFFGSNKNDGFQKGTSTKEEIWNAVYGQNLGRDGFSVLLTLAHPKSRGNIRLRDFDPFSNPLIDLNCFSDPNDIKTAVQGVKFVIEWAQTKPMRDIGARYSCGILPGYTGKPFTDEYWEEMIRTLTFIMYHPAGTCRMGPVSEPKTVVDPQLRVKGVERLRVVDASIMPEITSGSLHAAVVMIAEKAADIIRAA